MHKKHQKTTMPAIVPNQPDSYNGWEYFVSERYTREHAKNERYRRHLLSRAIRPKSNAKNKVTVPDRVKGRVRSKTRIKIYKSVRTINN